jgi:O-antigen/teichoic acid export membrane protein
MQDFARKVTGSASLLVLASGLTKVVNLGAFLLLTRGLGPEAYGLFTWTQASAAVAMAVGGLGLHLWLAREVAKADGDLEQQRGLVVQAGWLRFMGVIFALVALVFFLGRASDLSSALRADRGFSLAVFIGAAFGARSLAELWVAGLRGHLDFSSEAQGMFLVRVSFFVGLGVLFFLGELTLAMAGLCFFASETAGAIFLSRRLARKTRGANPVQGKRSALLREAIPFLIIATGGVLVFRLNLVVVGTTLDGASTGLFAAAYRLVELVHFVPEAFFAVLLPLLARGRGGGLNAARRGLVAAFGLALLGTFVGGALGLLGPWLIPVVAGADFADASAVLWPLLPAIVFQFGNYALAATLVATGRQRSQVWILGFGALASAMALFILVPRLGLLGAALGTGVGEGLVFLLGLLVLSRARAEVPPSRGEPQRA